MIAAQVGSNGGRSDERQAVLPEAFKRQFLMARRELGSEGAIRPDVRTTTAEQVDAV